MRCAMRGSEGGEALWGEMFDSTTGALFENAADAQSGNIAVRGAEERGDRCPG